MLVKRPASPEPEPSTNQGNINPQILFNNEDVEFVVNHKHLGVTF
jgi:hypothetical protein